MISCAPDCLNSGLKLLRTFDAAARSFARRSFFTWLVTAVMTILLPSRLNVTSLPEAMSAAVRMCFGMVTCPLAVISMLTLFRVGGIRRFTEFLSGVTEVGNEALLESRKERRHGKFCTYHFDCRAHPFIELNSAEAVESYPATGAANRKSVEV